MKNNIPSIAAALVSFSISCGQDKDKSESAATYDACALEKSDATKDFVICSADFKSSRVADGKGCYSSACKVQTDGSCPTYFVKGKTASAPTEQYCSYSRPMEL